MKRSLAVLCLAACGGGGATGGDGGVPDAPVVSPSLADAIDWPRFLARHDLVWDVLPSTWSNAAFIGNGLVGATIFRDGDTALRWQLGRTDVYDERPVDGPLGLADAAFWHARLPIGDLRLVTQGRITGGSARVDLWRAEARLTITTENGAVTVRSYAPVTRAVIVTEVAVSGNETVSWSFTGAPSVSSRVVTRPPAPAGYEGNPPGAASSVEGTSAWEQPLLGGGGYATAWREEGSGGKRTLSLAIALDRGASAVPAAIRQLDEARADGTLATAHAAYWDTLYRRHFLSIPDGRLESFYWIQIYKLASAGRPDGPLIDLMGPWYASTTWPAVWWNLNIQLTYYPIYAANLLSLGEPLLRTLEARAETMKKNVPADCQDCIAIGRISGLDLRADTGGMEVGHLAWALHNVYMLYRHSLDEAMLRDRLLPLLRRSANYYLYLLTEEPDGKRHLPVTNSPEYGNTSDANYDLALARWELQTLIFETERLHLADPLLPRWKDALATLTPFPTDEHGLRVGRDLPFAVSHRHYSHLLAFFPLHVLDWEAPADRALITTSYEHWASLRESWRGYSWTGASSMNAIFGRGDEALSLLNTFLDNNVLPNTFYAEGSPVIESPFSGARALQDMLLQSWGGTLRVFPAVPGGWGSVVVHNLRAEGAFLISAARRAGVTDFVRVQSLAGAPCRLRTDLPRPLAAAGDRAIAVTEQTDGTVLLDLHAGEAAVLYSRNRPPDLTLAAVPGDGCASFFGDRRCRAP